MKLFEKLTVVILFVACVACSRSKSQAAGAPQKAAEPAELREFLSAKFAKWQLPDAFVFAKEIPRTSVGKFRKMALREQFVDWKWES